MSWGISGMFQPMIYQLIVGFDTTSKGQLSGNNHILGDPADELLLGDSHPTLFDWSLDGHNSVKLSQIDLS
jgi:hypothetical protein